MEKLNRFLNSKFNTDDGSDYRDGFDEPVSSAKAARGNFFTLLYFPALILWLELVLRLSCGEGLSFVSFLYRFMFTVPIASVLTLLCTIGGARLNRVLCAAFTAALSIWFSVQILYFNVFRTFLTVSSIGGTNQAMNSFDMILDAMRSRVLFLILTFLPLVLYIAFGKRLFPFRRIRMSGRLIVLGTAVLFAVAAPLIIDAATGGSQSNLSSHSLYRGELQQKPAQERFGMLTMQRIDISRLFFGTKVDLKNVSEDDYTADATADKEAVKPKPHETSAKLPTNGGDTGDITSYVEGVKPTYTNEYTDFFKGYNVIFLSAESFSHYCIDKEITPNLYKMYNEGFQFDNYYTPGWGVSTTDGEYANLVGLIPKAGVWSFSDSAKSHVYFPFSLAQQAHNYGYSEVRAYHNHDYTYYDRDKYLTNLGYDYKGVGNGLKLDEIVWPNSDLEMVEHTVDDYINADSFSVYYMTVSGHGSWSDWNMMALRHKDEIEHSKFKNYSTDCKVYLAANIELDRAVGKLMKSLKKAGKLNNTVICLTADHYPYALDDVDGVSELAGHKVDDTFEKYRNAWLMWSGSMKKSVKVKTYCSSLDVLPTLSNMLGYEYDSRMLMGTDVFSGKDPLVIFLDRSFITQNGKFNAGTGSYTPFKKNGKDNLEKLQGIVSNRFTVSRMILENDYYRKVFGSKGFKPKNAKTLLKSGKNG